MQTAARIVYAFVVEYLAAENSSEISSKSETELNAHTAAVARSFVLSLANVLLAVCTLVAFKSEADKEFYPIVLLIFIL